MSKNNKDTDFKMWKISTFGQVRSVDKKFRLFPKNEVMAFAKNNTSLEEICRNVYPDKKGLNKDGSFKSVIFLVVSKHSTTIGAKKLAKKTLRFIESERDSKKCPIDILSIQSGLKEDKLLSIAVVRCYDPSNKPTFQNIFNYLGETKIRNDYSDEESETKLIVPEDAIRDVDDDLKETHRALLEEQDYILENATEEEPFLNSIDTYIPQKLYKIDPQRELLYDLKTKQMQIESNISPEAFMKIFEEAMVYITSNERDEYYGVLRGQSEKKNFFNIVEAYIDRNFIQTQALPMEDKPELLKKIDRALFDLYIVQDLIDDPLITDIKITNPYSIRVRVKGKAYRSNVSFINDEDYIRFIKGIAVLNNIDLNVPTQTFTDEQDENYILRFSITAPYITSTNYPIIHIRKLPRKKLMSDDLIEAGMMDEKIRDYLIDCGKHSTGIVFAGPPGSGKTTALNWFLEDGYESSAEILVIQENDELFAYRNGVMFEHVVINPQRGEEPCSLEKLGQMALVAGANVFVIGEAKGAEITSAITLSNSGCRTAITIHSKSSTDTIDKMTDLAMRGDANTTYDQAKRMIKSFQTIVYMEDFQVKEISEIVGYDEEKKDMIYRYIYKKPELDNNISRV